MRKKVAKKKTTKKKSVKKATKKTTKKKVTKKKPPKLKADRTISKQASFLAAFSHSCNVMKAAKDANVSRNDHYRWLKTDETYQKKFDEAKQEAINFLEDVAIKRATEGWKEPVYYKGQVAGTVNRFSDNLLMFMLKGAAPNKYRERVDQHHSGEMKQTITINTDGEGKKDDSKNNPSE